MDVPSKVEMCTPQFVQRHTVNRNEIIHGNGKSSLFHSGSSLDLDQQHTEAR